MLSLHGSTPLNEEGRKLSTQSDMKDFKEQQRRRQSSHFDHAHMNNNTQSETMARNPTV